MLDAGYLPSRAPSHEGAFGDKIYGRYGFTDAFRPTNGWASSDVLGLDVGITLLSAELAVWQYLEVVHAEC